jgi:peroxiredoxin Q/BCP
VPRLAPGDTAPDFTLPRADSSTVTLSSLRGQHVIVYFYPAAMTPGCTTQACDFRDSLQPLQAAGYAVLGISPDAPAKLARFAAVGPDGTVELARYNVKATGHVASLRTALGV